MISQTDQLKLKAIVHSYSSLRGELSQLKHELDLITSRQTQVHQELENTRNEEKSLINKIEEQLNRKLTQEELLQIINS
jgi:predicted  nucleic acid-binding Zn-ribbon protein